MAKATAGKKESIKDVEKRVRKPLGGLGKQKAIRSESTASKIGKAAKSAAKIVGGALIGSMGAASSGTTKKIAQSVALKDKSSPTSIRDKSSTGVNKDMLKPIKNKPKTQSQQVAQNINRIQAAKKAVDRKQKQLSASAKRKSKNIY